MEVMHFAEIGGHYYYLFLDSEFNRLCRLEFGLQGKEGQRLAIEFTIVLYKLFSQGFSSYQNSDMSAFVFDLRVRLG